MSKKTERLDLIINKITLILEENLKLQEEVHALQKELKVLKGAKGADNIKIDKLEKEVKILQLAKGVDLSDEERKKVKNAIRHYIREIDKCLASLNPELNEQ